MIIDQDSMLSEMINKGPVNTPLLLLDADEVLLQFIKGLEVFADEIGLIFRPESFSLVGNLKTKAGEILDSGEVTAFLDRFFEDFTERMALVDGAKAAIEKLQCVSDVVILTNIPAAARAARIRCFQNHGIDVPVFTNTGGKGDFIKKMMTLRNGPVCFVDDLPPQHEDVAQKAPGCYRLHLVADPRLRPMIPKAKDAHARIDDWPEAVDHLTSVLTE